MKNDTTQENQEIEGLTPILQRVKGMLSELQLPIDGLAVSLTGRQVRHVRACLGETQTAFGRRMGVSQTAIFRLENAPERSNTGPDVILIALTAIQHCIIIPDDATLAEAEAGQPVGEYAVEGA
ncbi:DNA-binding XRE family transcriptional regulator [Peteryoungia aggregata LMG 23059]|uniref:DNA-binding XRE family transcriptional regulator n=1 Tax=Peteryoungia aggregata LMG 23059 TaxID=1368425 RepID=A0ABU0GAH7_9HYPH|nr:hypothetical protein [Peteryoungia aggregata]MDQ0422358.1 DNA-binding XRE family transcriptional regulator [Peteryoungia aggregata LMG 23059]